MKRFRSNVGDFSASISNYNHIKRWHLITYPCCNLHHYLLVKGVYDEQWILSQTKSSFVSIFWAEISNCTTFHALLLYICHVRVRVFVTFETPLITSVQEDIFGNLSIHLYPFWFKVMSVSHSMGFAAQETSRAFKTVVHIQKKLTMALHSF